MIDFIGTYYLWFKAFHVIAVISWMAGMLYLPRLFVYHVTAKAGAELDTTLQTMERRLLRFIMNPAMILAWILGGLLIAVNPDIMQQPWIHMKLTAVLGMSILHMVFAKWRKGFAAGTNTHSAKFYKIWNEAPTILMIIIVIMVIARPI